MKKIKKIQTKLLLAFGVVLLLSLLLAMWSVFSVYQIEDYSTINEEFDHLHVKMLELRRSEKDFLMRERTNPDFFEKGESKYLKANNDLVAMLNVNLDSLSNDTKIQQLGLVGLLLEVKSIVGEYSTKFNLLAEKIKKRGFKDWGDEGELRKSIHTIENGDFGIDKVMILTLRKHEKDFFLRKDLQYKEKFDTDFQKLKGIVGTETNIDETVRNQVVKILDDYKAKFDLIVKTEQEIGLTEQEGLMGELRNAAHTLEPLLEKMVRAEEQKSSQVVDNTILLIVIAVIVQLALGVFLALVFSKKFTKNIIQIRDAITELAVNPRKIDISSDDEIGDMQHALNDFVDRMQISSEFAEKIGNGELNAQYDDKFRNDLLARSLINMHTKLVQSSESDERRNWATKGLADFGDILRKDQQNIEELTNNIISYLVKYIKANQGALYIVNDENRDNVHLEMTAIYAWGKKKFLQHQIKIGEGITGQAWQEASSVYLEEVPGTYVRITSGLGDANPRSVLVVPLKLNDIVYGIIELASFKKYQPYEIEFVEKLAESIASTISTTKINERTKRLLEQTQQQAEEMRSQEEEMRQNMEEMSATQEEVSRKESEMRKVIEKMQQREQELLQNIEELKKG